VWRQDGRHRLRATARRHIWWGHGREDPEALSLLSRTQPGSRSHACLETIAAAALVLYSLKSRRDLAWVEAIARAFPNEGTDIDASTG
jgi:hypothetical protein